MEHRIETPIAPEDLERIRIGDIIYLSGTVVTARDLAHKRVVEERIPPPIDLGGLALFHAGPIVSRRDDKWRIIAIGSTTSMRMEEYESEFIRRTGIRLITGKGFMGKKTADACRRCGAIVTLFPGGCAVIAAKKIVEVIGVYWLELGIPEALWVLRIKDFGPLTVTIDSAGRNLLDRRLKEIEMGREEAVTRLKMEFGEILKKH